MSESEFKPDWRSPPGDTVKGWMAERGVSVHEFGVRCFLSDAEVLRLLSGDLALDLGLALRLSSIIGAPSDFWLQREKHYREPK